MRLLFFEFEPVFIRAAVGTVATKETKKEKKRINHSEKTHRDRNYFLKNNKKKCKVREWERKGSRESAREREYDRV